MKKSAFTLAEVLLTLTIIGVVSAMTVPSLMNSIQERELQAQAKKAYNTIQSAVSMRYAQTRQTPGDVTQYVLLHSYLATEENPVIKYIEKESNRRRILKLPDGQIITTPSSPDTRCDTLGTSACSIKVDINGADGPNFSGVTTISGTNIVQLNRGYTPPASETPYDRNNRDIVIFRVENLTVSPWMEDGVTRRYFSGQKD